MFLDSRLAFGEPTLVVVVDATGSTALHLPRGSPRPPLLRGDLPLLLLWIEIHASALLLL
jgi:hypothetical protein